MSGARLVITLHGNQAVPPRHLSLKKAAMQYAYRVASMTTTGSPYTAERVREVVRLGECRFIPNGVDMKVFRPLDGRKRLPFLLTVGALRPRKGADILVAALGILKEEFPDVRCKIVGAVSDAAFTDGVRESAKGLGIADRVDFLGTVDDADLVALYNTCAIFVLAAREAHGTFEGFPLVFYEANACGAPVVTTRGFGSEYAIKEGANGLLISSADAGELAAAIRKILQNPKLHAEMSRNAVEEARKHTWDAVAPELLALYHDTLR